MNNKARREQRALARVEKRPAAGSDARFEDPIRVGLDKSIVIDMSKLPTPSNVYDADVAWIEHQPGDVRLFFGKINRDEPKTLRSRLEVRFPPEGLVGHFWRNSREFHTLVREFVKKWAMPERREPVNPGSMKADKEHSEWANFETMAHAGTEALIDFFAMPPSGLAMYTRGQGSHGLRLNPIVRVQMSTFELAKLLDQMEPIIAEISSYIPAGMERAIEPVTTGEVL